MGETSQENKQESLCHEKTDRNGNLTEKSAKGT